MEFYKNCLGGELKIQTVGDSPAAARMPRPMKETVLQATLKNGRFLLLGTDMAGEERLIKGNSVSILLECNTEDEIQRYYSGLVVDGSPTYPLKRSHWGDLMGGLTDRFQTHWLLLLRKN